MPPSRRKSSNPRSAQQTLAFGPRTSANRVTKPTLPPSSSSKKSDKPASDTLVKALSEEEIRTPEPLPEGIPSADEVKEEKEEEEEEEPPKELAIREQPPARTEAEQKASKISESQIKKYWKAKEDERKAPRVHQESLTLHEKILRHFDLSSQYGPCIGLPRLKRWKRADGLGLRPPIEVLAVLLREEEKGNRKVERAFMEGLLASRYVVGSEG